MPLKLAVTRHHDPDCTVVGIAGDLDAASTPMARDRLHGLLAEGRHRLVLDVADLAFCDSGGVWLLLEVHRRAQGAGGCVRLAAVNGVLKRVLELTHLDAAFVIDPDREAALKALASPHSAPPQ